MQSSENLKGFANEIEDKRKKSSCEGDINLKELQVEIQKVEYDIKKVEKNPKYNHLEPCLKNRSSCENFIETGSEKQRKSQHYKSLLKSKSQNSDSNLVTKPSGFSKILTWDPWHKIGRSKSKKDNRKTPENKEKISVGGCNTGDGPKSILQDKKKDNAEESTSSFEKKSVNDGLNDNNLDPKPVKIRKVVRFNDNVKVLHYVDGEIVGHTIEPLKKELEQQERNKELRKESLPEMGLGLKQSLRRSASDYMAAWYRKQ